MVAFQEISRNSRTEASAYRTLLASFEGSYENLKSSSASLNAILANLPAGLAEGERRSRISPASSAYEDARLEVHHRRRHAE